MSELEQLKIVVSDHNEQICLLRDRIKRHKAEIKRVKSECNTIIGTRIAEVISAESGIEWSLIASRSKKLELVYCRIVFVHHCRLNGLTSRRIGQFIDRKHPDIKYLKDRYEHETSHCFLELAKKVENSLKP